MSVPQPAFLTDQELAKRWRCSTMKLWRMRQADKLHSTKIGGVGLWLTSADEIARIENVTVLPTPNAGAFKRKVA